MDVLDNFFVKDSAEVPSSTVEKTSQVGHFSYSVCFCDFLFIYLFYLPSLPFICSLFVSLIGVHELR